MKAIGYQNSLPIDQTLSLQEITLPEPIASGRDLLIEVKAISVNPVDTKVRGKQRDPADRDWKILGWDAAGIVKAVGNEVSLFSVGDEVWYAGSIARPGSNSEYQLVDERIVGKKPKSLNFGDAAALPLTSLTAWEMLFDRLQIKTDASEANKSLLIIGAAGGVGSIMTQLASRLTKLKIIGTASRPETQQWVRRLGAHHVIDHNKGLVEGLKSISIPNPDYIVSLTHTDEHFAEIVEAIAPQGKFGLIDDPQLIDVRLLKRKSASLHWEAMFARSLFETADMIEQHHILNEVARLVDTGVIKTTVGEHFGNINAENLRRAHALLESNKSKGKIVLEGF